MTPRSGTHSVSSFMFILTCLYSVSGSSMPTGGQTALDIMQDVYLRHRQYPYIYEEQSMVMEDRNGVRDTRLMRRYSRVEDDGTVKLLLVFDYPRELKGVAMLANRDPAGDVRKYVYLPAFGEKLIESTDTGSGQNFLGTDFSIENLTGEILNEYEYERRADVKIDNTKYFVVDVYRKGKHDKQKHLLRRHYIRQDNLYITLTHHFDKHGRLSQIQSYHDLKPVDGDMWQANMILMEDRVEEHQSLIKINRRVYSYDYVPEELFTAEWLFENQPYIAPPAEPVGEVEETAGETTE